MQRAARGDPAARELLPRLSDPLKDMPLPTRTLVAALALVLAVSLAGCSKHGASLTGNAKSSAPFETLELRYQGYTGMVLYPELAEDLGYLAPIQLKYVGNTTGGPQDIQSVVTGDSDYGGAFNGAVIKLIAAKAPVQAVIGYYGSDEQTYLGFYVLANGPVHGARDLIGKRVGVNTVGAHAEFVLRDYLVRSGLTKAEADQVTLVVVPPVVTEQALRQKQVDAAMLSNMMRDKALERGNIRMLFSDYQIFGKFTAGSLVMTKRFLHDNPKSARKFVEATAKALEWARSHPREEVIARYEAIIKRRARNEDASNVKYWRTTGVAGKGGLISEREFQTWLDWLTCSGGWE